MASESEFDTKRPEAIHARSTWGVPPPLEVCNHVAVPKEGGKGAMVHSETLPDGSEYTYETPAPPSWAKDDPELWKLTEQETIARVRIQAFEKHWASRTEEKMKEIEILKESFRIFDMDDSGCLDASEVVEILCRVGGGNPMSEDDAKEFIAMFDANGDGKMQIGEFIDAMKTLAGAADMNSKEDAEEMAEMIVDDAGLKVVHAGQITKDLEEFKDKDGLGHGQVW